MGFPECFLAALEFRRIQQKQFAFSVSATPAHINMIAKGSRLPPLDRIEAWADALNLNGSERQEFIEAAWLAHCPAEAQAMVQRLRERVASLAVRVMRLEHLASQSTLRVAEESTPYEGKPRPGRKH